MIKKQTRCAIYTRKSSEEGLDQSFNSLEAQREACEAFISSQKHEGWFVLPKHYDDGGFSGGSMERPALKQLLADVQDGRVDTIVVYKVDRLTRSLADFAKIIEILDQGSVSFVSVTQQFNTTSSMGRLTLNVLLSFAQFEREITGERIRDKIAASKKKGMWMGGVVSLGYDCVDRQLLVNETEARRVRHIFQKYLELGCVTKLKEFLDRQQIYGKGRIGSDGQRQNGAPFSRGSLYHLLNSRIYIGEIIHRGQSYRGLHQPIVSMDLWNRVATKLKENNESHRSGKSYSAPSLLTGFLFDNHGVRFTPTHAVKDGKRYRYYTSQSVISAGTKPAICRFPAQELETFVEAEILRLLQTPVKSTIGLRLQTTKNTFEEKTGALVKSWAQLGSSRKREFVRNILGRVVIGKSTIEIQINMRKFVSTVLGTAAERSLAIAPARRAFLTLSAPFQPFRTRGEVQVGVLTAEDFCNTPALPFVKMIARAHSWYSQIIAGETASISALAEKAGLTRRYVRRVLQCANLSPQIVEVIFAGKHPADWTLREMGRSRPLDWGQQVTNFLADTKHISLK